jgi:TRAP transporter TAXI family solute receptor
MDAGPIAGRREKYGKAKKETQEGKKMKKMAVATILGLAMSALMWQATSFAAAKVEFPKFMLVGGGSTGGTFIGVAGGFAQLFSKKTTSQANAQSTTGGGQNIILMEKKEFDFGIVDGFTLKQAISGEEQFKGKAQADKLRAICSIYPTYFQQMVRMQANINTMNDLKGHKLVVGGPASGTEIVTREVYKAHGYDYVTRRDILPEYLGVDAGMEQMRNNQVDGITSISNIPFGTYVELILINKGKIISLNADAIKKLSGAPGSAFVQTKIPAGTYKNQNEDIETVLVQTQLTTRTDLKEDLVYEITKIIFENLDFLKQQHSAFKFLSLATATKGLSAPLHPGALKYYKEKGIVK